MMNRIFYLCLSMVLAASQAVAIERVAVTPGSSDMNKDLVGITNSMQIETLNDLNTELKDRLSKIENCADQGKFYSKAQDKCIDLVETDPTVRAHGKVLPPMCKVVNNIPQEAHLWRADLNAWQCVNVEPKDCGSYKHGQSWNSACPTNYTGQIVNTCIDGAITSNNQCTEKKLEVGKPYNITCTSAGGATKTLTGVAQSDEVVTARAPSNMSTWVVYTKNLNGLNCWDAAHSSVYLTDQGQLDFWGNSSCYNYAPASRPYTAGRRLYNCHVSY